MMAMLRRDIAEVFQKNEPEIGRALSTHAASQQGKGWKGRGAAGDSYRGADRGVHGSFALSVIPNLFRDPWTQSAQDRAMRSEEHTSELQSLMRNSYAVFCLKKKNKDGLIIKCWSNIDHIQL